MNVSVILLTYLLPGPNPFRSSLYTLIHAIRLIHSFLDSVRFNGLPFLSDR